MCVQVLFCFQRTISCLGL